MLRPGLPVAGLGAHARLLLLTWVTVVVTACAGQPAVDRSLLTDDPCAAPCWGGIVPGESTEADAHRALDGNPLVKRATIRTTLTEQNGVPLTIIGWQGRGPNAVVLRDGKVLRIEVGLDRGPTLGQMVERLGPPERVYAHVRCTEFWGYLVVFDYPARGLTLWSESYPVNLEDVVAAKGMGVLREDMRVTRATYYAPTTLRSALADVFLYDLEGVEGLIGDLREWQGFTQVTLAPDRRW